MSDVVIETVGLKRSFGDVLAVKSVDLQVQAGEIYGFLGPNGAGKSTVVKMLITLLQPTGGRATVLGHDVISGASKIRLRIGAALQDASLDEKQSGREILRLQGALYGLTRKETDVRIEELSSLIDVEAIDRWAGTYSGGMRRRLDLAASLMHSPDLLFLDEPTTGLHFEDVRKLLEVLHHLVDQGNTVIVIEHNLEVIKTADHLIDIGPEGGAGGGNIVATGTPEDVAKVKASYTGQYLKEHLKVLKKRT